MNVFAEFKLLSYVHSRDGLQTLPNGKNIYNDCKNMPGVRNHGYAVGNGVLNGIFARWPCGKFF